MTFSALGRMPLLRGAQQSSANAVRAAVANQLMFSYINLAARTVSTQVA